MVVRIGQAYFQDGLKGAEGRNPHPLTKKASKVQTPDANIPQWPCFHLGNSAPPQLPCGGVLFFRQTSMYSNVPLGRILKGEKAAKLPLQESIKFDLVINLKTAKALSLNVSRDFLPRDDAVIE
jgi:hypothetical protein